MGKGIWGIDVSKFSVKAVRLEKVHESIVLTRSTVLPYPPASEGGEANLDDRIRHALRDLKDGSHIGGEPVIFSMPTHSTFNRLIKLPPVDDAKIPEIVRYEAQSQIPFNIDEVIWDYQFISRTYAPGEEKEVILFAIKRDIVEQFLANIADLRFNVSAVQFGPVALFNFLLMDQDVGSACVALDMGGDNTDLVVIDGTKFWVRNLPISGNDITKALQKSFNIPFDEAEKLKLRAGQSQQAQKIFNAIQPVLRDLVNEINRSIGYYKSISKTSKFDKILLLGNSIQTLNFQKFVSQSLQMPAVRVQKLNHIQICGTADAGEVAEGLTTLGTALGLALQGIAETTNRVDILPPAYRRRKELKKKQPYLIGAAAALYALAGLAWYNLDADVTKLRDTLKKANSAQTTKEAQEKDFVQAQDVEKVRAALETAASLSSVRDLALKVMDEINPNIPDNSYEEKTLSDKLWVVDWKFEEKAVAEILAAPGTTVAPPAPGTPAAPAAVKEAPPGKKVLQVTLEVVIARRKEDAEGRNFIIKTLLNYNMGSKNVLSSTRTCAVKNKYWDLKEGEGWRVEQDKTDLEVPEPSSLRPSVPGAPVEDKGFWRYRVTLNIPAGKIPPKAASGPAKPGTKTEKPGKPGGK